MDLRLTNQVVVERHKEELGDRVLHLVTWQLTKADDRTGLPRRWWRDADGTFHDEVRDECKHVWELAREAAARLKKAGELPAPILASIYLNICLVSDN